MVAQPGLKYVHIRRNDLRQIRSMLSYAGNVVALHLVQC